MDAMPASSRTYADLTDVVMGLHWAPPHQRGRESPKPANLDAVCVLLDSQARRLEAVHPGRPASTNGSVIHTGDSLTGGSPWEDERVFAFLDALPDAVHSLVFAVVSNGRPFSDVAGASCHLSDSRTEDELLSVRLTALGHLEEYCVATLHRSPDGWTLREGAPQGACLGELLPARAGPVEESAPR